MVQIERIEGHLATTQGGLATFVVTFADGSEEHRQATLLEVSKLATTAGLHLAHAQDAGSFRWVRT